MTDGVGFPHSLPASPQGNSASQAGGGPARLCCQAEVSADGPARKGLVGSQPRGGRFTFSYEEAGPGLPGLLLQQRSAVTEDLPRGPGQDQATHSPWGLCGWQGPTLSSCRGWPRLAQPMVLGAEHPHPAGPCLHPAPVLRRTGLPPVLHRCRGAPGSWPQAPPSGACTDEAPWAAGRVPGLAGTCRGWVRRGEGHG